MDEDAPCEAEGEDGDATAARRKDGDSAREEANPQNRFALSFARGSQLRATIEAGIYC